MPRRLFLIQLSQQVKALKSTFENPRLRLRRGRKVQVNCRAPMKRDPKRVGSKTTPIERKIDFHYFWLPNQGQSRIEFVSISRLWTPFLATTLRLIESPLKCTHFLRSQSSAGRKRVLRKVSRFFRNALFEQRPRQATPIKSFQLKQKLSFQFNERQQRERFIELCCVSFCWKNSIKRHIKPSLVLAMELSFDFKLRPDLKDCGVSAQRVESGVAEVKWPFHRMTASRVAQMF